MIDLQQLSNFYSTILAITIIAHVVSAPFIAYLARLKNRSFRSFFVLTLVLGPITMGLIVAILPFSEDDPRNPKNRSKASLKDYFGIQNND
jgi:predicted MFS family arabinose efflux permease